MTVSIVLANRWVYSGEDERTALDLVQEVAGVEAGDGADPEMPKGWVWIAGLYVRASTVVAVHEASDD